MKRNPAEAQRRFRVGDQFPALELAGVIGGVVAIPLAQGYVHLQLRRFAGCMVCNVHLRQVVRQLPPQSPTGGERGRPADIPIASTGRVVAVKYRTHAADQWSVDELLRIVASDSAAS